MPLRSLRRIASRWNGLFLLLLLAGWLTGCPRGGGLLKKSEHTMSIKSSGLTERLALEQALQLAVKKVVVQLRDTGFLEENKEQVSKLLYKRSSEFVKSVSILKRSYKQSKGLHTMEVKVTVLPRDVHKQLGNLQRIFQPIAGMPLLERFQKLQWSPPPKSKLFAPQMQSFFGQFTRVKFLGKPTSTMKDNGEKVILKYRVGIYLDRKKWKQAIDKLKALLKSKAIVSKPFSIKSNPGFGPHFHDSQELVGKDCLVAGYPLHAAYALKSKGVLPSVQGLPACVPVAIFDRVFRKLTRKQQMDPRITLRNKGKGTLYYLSPKYLDREELQALRFLQSGLGITLQLLDKEQVMASDRILLGPRASHPRCRNSARRCFRVLVTGATLLQKGDATRLWLTDQVIIPPQKAENDGEMGMYRFEEMISISFRFELPTAKVQKIHSARLRLHRFKL